MYDDVLHWEMIMSAGRLGSFPRGVQHLFGVLGHLDLAPRLEDSPSAPIR